MSCTSGGAVYHCSLILNAVYSSSNVNVCASVFAEAPKAIPQSFSRFRGCPPSPSAPPRASPRGPNRGSSPALCAQLPTSRTPSPEQVSTSGGHKNLHRPCVSSSNHPCLTAPSAQVYARIIVGLSLNWFGLLELARQPFAAHAQGAAQRAQCLAQESEVCMEGERSVPGATYSQHKQGSHGWLTRPSSAF